MCYMPCFTLNVNGHENKGLGDGYVSYMILYYHANISFLLPREYHLLNLDSKLIDYSPKCMHRCHNSVGKCKFPELTIAPLGGGIHAPSIQSMLPMG